MRTDDIISPAGLQYSAALPGDRSTTGPGPGPGPATATAAAAAALFAGFAGFGAGAVNLGIASSLLLSPAAGGSLTAAAGTVAALWGSALLLWTVLGLHRGRQLWAKPAMALLLAAAAVHGTAAAAVSAIGPSGLAVSQLAALLLTLMIVAATGWLNRQSRISQSRISQSDGGPGRSACGLEASGTPRAGRLLGIAFGCAVLVAGVATPGLAASTAGQFAVPHGEHGTSGPGSHHRH